MQYEYNEKIKKYVLKFSFLDKCMTCGYKGKDCPMLAEIYKQKLLIRGKELIKDTCAIYMYLPDDNSENELRGMYFGDFNDYFGL